MKNENTTTRKYPAQRHYLTDADRNAAIKMLDCGLSVDEISGILHISNSSINYLRQAIQACNDHDWNTLQKLSTRLKPTVDWALRVTGTDKLLAEELASQAKQLEEAKAVEEPEVEVPVNKPATPIITREDFYALYAEMQDIRSLLTDIRDVLNEIK